MSESTGTNAPADRAEPARLSLEDRSDVLGGAIQRASVQGWRVASQTGAQAQLVQGRPVSHVLHLILSVLTGGLWVIAWIIVAARGGERHQFVMVDEYGNVSPAYLSSRPPRRPPASVEDQEKALEGAIAHMSRLGWRVAWRDEGEAEIVKRNWFLPWTRHRQRVTVDEFGYVRFI